VALTWQEQALGLAALVTSKTGVTHFPGPRQTLIVSLAKTKDAGSKRRIFNPAGQIQQ
jgi:hypothetical protein